MTIISQRTLNGRARVLFLSLILFWCLAFVGTARAQVTDLGLRLLPVIVTGDENQTDTPEPEMPAINAPILATDIQVTVNGPIARTRVRQLFVNTSDEWMEGVYTFPLPEDAAVDSLRMVIGDRVILGEVKEREEARRTYEKAKREGRRAGLITQERPNVFTTSVANIGPGVQIAIEIEFQEALRLDKNVYALRFPTVIGPRYIPGQKPIIGVAGSGRAINTDAVPDAERITPPVRHPDDGKINPLVFVVDIDAGTPLEKVWSASHAINTEQNQGRYRVTLKDGAIPADRDFVLEWQPKTRNSTGIELYKEEIDGDSYLLAMIQPPQTTVAPLEMPREVIYVIDTSGSMGGVSIKGARVALAQALGRLRPQDRFNVVRFSDRAEAFFPDPQLATPAIVAAAQARVATLQADGGTEFLSALQLALNGEIDNSRLRQVVFLTDGAVGNEVEILSFIRKQLGDSRLFTVGIGSAPNSYLMRKAAALGHGTYTFVEQESQVTARMAALFEKLEAPVMESLRAAFPDASWAEVWPKSLPDLYAGEPIVLTAKLSDLIGELVLDGVNRGTPWQQRIALADARPGRGIAKLWARESITGHMDRRYEGAAPDAVKQAVLSVALKHQLVSQYTSLVAVEMEPVRPADRKLISQPLATNLPHGWVFDKVFGETGKPKPIELRKASFEGDTPNGRSLALRARGGTPALLHLIVGLAALLLAAAMLFGRPRRRGIAS